MNRFLMKSLMKNKGFFIKSVIAVGEGMITSRVDFKDGCNLLYGPSEMGKSSVFSLIDFMLGKKEAPKDKGMKPFIWNLSLKRMVQLIQLEDFSKRNR